MSINQTKNVAIADMADIPIAGEVSVEIETRLRELRFPHPSSENHIFVFEPFVSGAASGKKLDDVIIHVQADPQPPIPLVDVVDPETSEVLASAGSEKPAIPSVAQLRAMPLPEGEATIKTFGELFDVARRQIYLAAMALNPNWSDGVEA